MTGAVVIAVMGGAAPAIGNLALPKKDPQLFKAVLGQSAEYKRRTASGVAVSSTGLTGC